MTNAGRLVAKGAAGLTVSGLVTNSGSIQTGESLTLTAGARGTGRHRSCLESRDGHDEGFFENAGTVLGSDTLALTAGTVVNRGDASVIGGKVASVTSNGALTNEGEVTSIDALALEVHGSITNDGRIVATEGSVVLNADGTVSNSRDPVATAH